MLKVVSVKKDDLKERILAVYCSNSIYIGLGNKLVNYSKQNIMCIHEKSIRCISGNEKFIGCSSYDGTVTVFSSEDKYIDKIEGPDTEIKGLAFNKDIIALTTRGKTTWILDNLEISKILDDHTQDVKGCAFHEDKLYTWSYDTTIKVYGLFEIDHSWELIQSIAVDDIVWNVLFYNEYLIACLNNGSVVVLKHNGYIWEISQTLLLSVTPVFSGISFLGYVGFICNRNSFLVLDSKFNKVLEIEVENTGCDIFSCSFHEKEKSLVFGSDDGYLCSYKLEEALE